VAIFILLAKVLKTMLDIIIYLHYLVHLQKHHC